MTHKREDPALLEQEGRQLVIDAAMRWYDVYMWKSALDPEQITANKELEFAVRFLANARYGVRAIRPGDPT